MDIFALVILFMSYARLYKKIANHRASVVFSSRYGMNMSLA